MDKILFLVEAQSTWTVNMIVRILFYYIETMKRRIEQLNMNVYSTKAIEETLKICKNEHILNQYIRTRESEVVEIMSYFMDQEKATQLTIKEVSEESRAEERVNSIYKLAKMCKDFNQTIEFCLERIQSDYQEVDFSIIQTIVNKVYNQ